MELAKALLARIKAVDPKINAFLAVTEKPALTAARAAERAVMANKSIGCSASRWPTSYSFETSGVATTAHSRILQDNVPQSDAETVRLLRAAGVVMLGKLATHEFAIGGPASTCPGRRRAIRGTAGATPAGPVAGSAAAVAAGLVLRVRWGRHRRLDPPARRLLRHRRTEADPRLVRAAWYPAGSQPGHRRADGLDRTGLRDPAGHARRV